MIRILTVRCGRLASLVLCAAALSGPALAATGGPSLTDTWLGVPRWVWLTLNLVIFWGGIFYFAGPAIRRFLDQRAEGIAQSLAHARSQRADAESMRASLQGRIDELVREMAELEARAEREAEHERAEMLAQAEREKERLLAQTRDVIEQRVEEARRALRRHAAELATRLVAEQLQGRLAEGDQKRLFEENLQRLDREIQEASRSGSAS